jgi:hypothetical protein
MTIEITKYSGRHWAVLVDGRLLCVTVYKKGALAVRDALLNGGSKAGLPDRPMNKQSAEIFTRGTGRQFGMSHEPE